MNARGALALLWLPFFCLDGARSCPALCQCYSRRAEVVCNQVPLTEYPSRGLPENTTMLTIQFTNITSVTERHLSATPLLRGLHLYGNHLRHLSPDLLRGVPHLDTLDLTGNQLSELPADVFVHAPLRSLVLKNNLVEEVKAEWLPDNSSVTWLDLSGNRITKIPAAFFQKLPLLENLDLSNNRLESVSAHALDPLTKLERLNLQDNKLETLDGDALRGPRNLTYLFLSRNKLANTHPDLFRELTVLKILSLDDNQLSHVPHGSLGPLTSLDEDGLDLTSNPWLCDGKAEYLRKWMEKNKKKVFLPETVVCAKPQAFSGRPVMSLTQGELES